MFAEAVEVSALEPLHNQAAPGRAPTLGTQKKTPKQQTALVSAISRP